MVTSTLETFWYSVAHRQPCRAHWSNAIQSLAAARLLVRLECVANAPGAGWNRQKDRALDSLPFGAYRMLVWRPGDRGAATLRRRQTRLRVRLRQTPKMRPSLKLLTVIHRMVRTFCCLRGAEFTPTRLAALDGKEPRQIGLYFLDP